MKKICFLSSLTIAVLSLFQSAQAQPVDASAGYYFPNDAAYDSHGRVPTVRAVQRALEEDGYYVGDNQGNFCYETRVAVRRYQRDNGLPITGKIDDTLLKTLRLR